MTNYEKFQQLIKQGTVVKYDECSKKEYYVSKTGKLYSVNKETHKIGRRKVYINKNYENVYVFKEKSTVGVHRLVAKAFVKNRYPESNNTVDHINGIKNDNRAENLQWVSLGNNTSLAWENGQHTNTKRKIRDRFCYDGSFMYEDYLTNKFKGTNDEFNNFLAKQEEAYDSNIDRLEYEDIPVEVEHDMWAYDDEIDYNSLEYDENGEFIVSKEYRDLL